MRIAIADDHPMFLAAVCDQVGRLFPDAEIAVASNLADTLALLKRHSPMDFLLIDFSMPGMDGTQGIRAIVSAAGGAPVVVMSGVAHVEDVRSCIGVGAKGFLPKTLDAKVFASALSVIAVGGTYLPTEIMPQPMQLAADTHLPPAREPLTGADFTERELAIMGLLVEGKSNKEVARELNLREVTIKVQLTRIYKKLGAKNRAQAATLMALTAALPPGGHIPLP